MLARKRRAARQAPAPTESSTMINFKLADYFKIPSAAVHFQLPLMRLGHRWSPTGWDTPMSLPATGLPFSVDYFAM
jgi:hypothetical protein